MNICSLVVWYNPDTETSSHSVENILTYSNAVRKVFIVDNSSEDNSALASKIPNAEYIPLYKNTGVAAALNKGCARALESGFDWIMTMDQDSSWNQDSLSEYLSKVEELSVSNEKAVSFGVRYDKTPLSVYEKVMHVIVTIKHNTLGRAKRAIIKKLKGNNKTKEELEEYSEVHCVITSANVLNLHIWNDFKFNEKLFIDEVDSDFCYRLIRSEYKIIKFNKIFLNHRIGFSKRSLIPLEGHSLERFYFIFRNICYIIKNYPEFSSEYHETKGLIRKTILHFIRNPIKTVKTCIRARKDFKEMNL